MSLGPLAYSPQRALLFSPSTPYYHTSIVLVVPAGKPYTAVQTLLKPFSTNLWILCLFTNFFGYTFIFILKLSPKNIRNLVLGNKNRTPIFNMINSAMGGSSVSKGTFSRTLLIFWVLCSLVLRNAYQGCLFSILQHKMRNAPIKSLNEILDNNFTLTIPLASYRMFTFNEQILKQ